MSAKTIIIDVHDGLVDEAERVYAVERVWCFGWVEKVIERDEIRRL